MDAIFCREKKNFDGQVEDLRDAGIAIAENHFRFCEYDEKLECIADGKDTASFYGILGEKEKFSTLVIGQDFHFLPSAWSKTFLCAAFELLKIDGHLIIEVNAKHSDPLNYISVDFLENFLGARVKEYCKGIHYVSFTKKILKKLLGYTTEYQHDSQKKFVIFKKSTFQRISLIESTLDLFIQKKKDLLSGLTNQFYKDSIKSSADSLMQHAYYVGGIRYKAPILNYIIRQHIPLISPKKIVDMGAGYGLLATELLFDSELHVDRIIHCDISTVNQNLNQILTQVLPKNLQKKSTFIHTASEDYDFESGNDVITFIGSLLYVDRGLVSKTLQNAFDSLSKGGILVIHENIRHPSYIADFDKMFTREELDSYLNPFGDISYYSSVSCKKLNKDAVSNNTVFRVVQKI